MEQDLHKVLKKFHSVVLREQKLSKKHFAKLIARDDITGRFKRKIQKYYNVSNSKTVGAQQVGGEHTLLQLTLDNWNGDVIHLGSQIGEGSYGSVYDVVNREGIVVKVIPKMPSAAKYQKCCKRIKENIDFFTKNYPTELRTSIVTEKDAYIHDIYSTSTTSPRLSHSSSSLLPSPLSESEVVNFGKIWEQLALIKFERVSEQPTNTESSSPRCTPGRLSPASSSGLASCDGPIGICYFMKKLEQFKQAHLCQAYDVLGNMSKDVENLEKIYFIHGDVKGDNLLMKGENVYLTDIDGIYGFDISTLLPSQGLEANDVAVTPPFCNPFYMYYRDCVAKYNFNSTNSQYNLRSVLEINKGNLMRFWTAAMIASGNDGLINVITGILDNVVQMTTITPKYSTFTQYIDAAMTNHDSILALLKGCDTYSLAMYDILIYQQNDATMLASALGLPHGGYYGDGGGLLAATTKSTVTQRPTCKISTRTIPTRPFVGSPTTSSSTTSSRTTSYSIGTFPTKPSQVSKVNPSIGYHSITPNVLITLPPQSIDFPKINKSVHLFWSDKPTTPPHINDLLYETSTVFKDPVGRLCIEVPKPKPIQGPSTIRN
jgi:hypothetical protein